MEIKTKKLNKKGSLDIVLFVMLVIFIVIYTTAQIISHKNKIDLRFEGYDIAEEFLLEKKDLEYRLYKIGEECLIRSYNNFLTQKKYLKQPIQERDRIPVFIGLNETLFEEFKEKIKECIKEKATNYYEFIKKGDDKNKEKFYEKLKTENFDLTYSNNHINIQIKEFLFEKKNTKNNFLTNVSAHLNFEKIGLIDFSKLEEISKCEDEDCAKKITKDLFDVKIERKVYREESSNKIIFYHYNKFNLESKRDFLINDEFKKTKFSFLVLKKIHEDIISYNNN